MDDSQVVVFPLALVGVITNKYYLVSSQGLSIEDPAMHVAHSASRVLYRETLRGRRRNSYYSKQNACDILGQS